MKANPARPDPATRPAQITGVCIHDWGISVSVVRACGKTGRCCLVLAKPEAVKRTGKTAKIYCARCGEQAVTVQAIRDYLAGRLDNMGLPAGGPSGKPSGPAADLS